MDFKWMQAAHYSIYILLKRHRFFVARGKWPTLRMEVQCYVNIPKASDACGVYFQPLSLQASSSIVLLVRKELDQLKGGGQERSLESEESQRLPELF